MAEEPQRASEASSSHQHPSSASTPESNLKQPQVPAFSGFPGFGNGYIGTLPVMYPAAFAGLNSWENQQQTNNRGAGIYAVPVLPYTGIPSNTLIPLTYNIPTTRPGTEAGAVGSEPGQAGQEQQQQQLGAHQRQVVTGALTPLLRWLSQSMQRAAQQRHPPRPAVRAENVPAAARPGNENAGVGEGQAGAENENQPLNNGNRAAENENVAADPAANGDNQWWRIMKEIQLIVFGFITSLFPGFNNLD